MALLSYVFILCVFLFCVKGGVIVYANMMLLKHIHIAARRSRRNNIPVSYQNNATITVLLLSLTFFVCLLPALICLVIIGYQLSAQQPLDDVFAAIPWSYAAFFSYSGLNSAIYVVRTRQVRLYYNNVILRNWSRFAHSSRTYVVSDRETYSL